MNARTKAIDGSRLHTYNNCLVLNTIDRPIGSTHSKHADIIYPINYGYIPGVIDGDGEELDVYLPHRHNDGEDKLVAAPEGINFTQAEIAEAVHFQEQYYESEIETMSQLNFISKEPIKKGWSCDKKYCVTAADGVKYLLRVSPEEKNANRADMFRMQQQLATLGVSMCKPVEFGKCDEGVYTVQTWVDGKDAEEIIPYLVDSEQ